MLQCWLMVSNVMPTMAPPSACRAWGILHALPHITEQQLLGLPIVLSSSSDMAVSLGSNSRTCDTSVQTSHMGGFVHARPQMLRPADHAP